MRLSRFIKCGEISNLKWHEENSFMGILLDWEPLSFFGWLVKKDCSPKTDYTLLGLSLIVIVDFLKVINTFSLSVPWNQVLSWMNVIHTPGGWNTELNWICQLTHGRGCKKRLMKIALAEIVYIIWTTKKKDYFSKQDKGAPSK